MHREPAAGAAAPRARERAAVGALPRSPQVRLEPGEDGWVGGGARGGIPDCGDPFRQPWTEI